MAKEVKGDLPMRLVVQERRLCVSLNHLGGDHHMAGRRRGLLISCSQYCPRGRGVPRRVSHSHGVEKLGGYVT